VLVPHHMQFSSLALFRKGIVFLVAFVAFLHARSPLVAATIEPLIVQEPQGTGEFPIFIFLDPLNQRTIGTDLYISYDNNRVRFVRAVDGELYQQHHAVAHDTKKKTLRYSATNSFGNYSTAPGLLTTLYFRKQSTEATVLATGSTPPAVQTIWKKDATDDTNVVSDAGAELLISPPAALAADEQLSSRLSGTIAGVLSEKEWTNLRESGQFPDSLAYNLATSVGLSTVDPFRLIMGSVLVVGALGASLTLVLKKRRDRRRAHEAEVAE
jgi:hypothetical protein